MIEFLINPENSDLIGSLSTFAAAFVASASAIAVGLFSYPRQKRLDRHVEAARERREIYREFMKRAGRFDELISGSEESLKALGELKAAQFEVALVGSKQVGHFAGHLTQHIEELALRARKNDTPSPDEFATISEKTTEIWKGLVQAMREEF